jgi:hypothetical protein
MFMFDYVYELKCSVLPLLIWTVLLIYLANPSGSWPAVSSIYIIIRCRKLMNMQKSCMLYSQNFSMVLPYIEYVVVVDLSRPKPL